MAAKADPGSPSDLIRGEKAALVIKLNEDYLERMRADSRWKWQMDQAARERHRYKKGLAKGRREAEAIKQESQTIKQENQAIKREIGEKDREIGTIRQESQTIKQEIEELRRKLREAGIEG
jgi:chromosome segregation ATPase